MRYESSDTRAAHPYSSKFREWDARASVRVRPRRNFLLEEEAAGKVYFSPELVPVVGHPLVVALGPAAVREMLIQHFYFYLDFTSHFEIMVVNDVAQRIAHGKSGIELPDEMVIDAYKIYCDEGYHSLFSADLRGQVEAVTAVKPDPIFFNNFLRRLEVVQSDVPSDLRPLAGLFIVILFETLVSAILSGIPRDPRVITALRELVADHAEDEARHHLYFSQFMDMLWPQMTRGQQEVIGPLLPHFIIKCLEPDYALIRWRLSKYSLTREEIEQVVAESYPPEQVMAGLRKTARATLHLLRRNGVFEDARTLEAFKASGMLGP